MFDTEGPVSLLGNSGPFLGTETRSESVRVGSVRRKVYKGITLEYYMYKHKNLWL
ncbi:hypothetical protein VT85_23810 [Planctomyces sp. SH-PL62]|nr:hypothetical protein VT85_23810 [Planctomyces sp. SH-PL62]